MFELKINKYFVLSLLICLFLSACSNIFKSTNFESELDLLGCNENSLIYPKVKEEKKSNLGNPISYEVMGQTYYPMRSLDKGYSEVGLASWYGPNFVKKQTSTGEGFNPCELTAAHRTVPIPSYFLVQNLENGKELVVKVNDRGPFIKPDQRIIDLSYMAARKLGFDQQGVGKVKITSLSYHPFTNAAEVIQAGSFNTFQVAKQLKEQIESINQLSSQVVIDKENNQFRVLVLTQKQSTKAISKILKSYKIDHFITTIHQQ